MPNTFPLQGGETIDTILGGEIRLVQDRCGYRFSISAVLLAGFVRLKDGDRVIDLGTGIGVIPLILAKMNRGVGEIVGLEIQPRLAVLARQNVQYNRLDPLIKIVEGDIRQIDRYFPPGGFDVMVANPPYYRVQSGRINPNAQKAMARHEIACSIRDVLAAGRYVLKDKGRGYLVFPSTRGVTLLEGMRREGIEPKRLRWVHSRTGEDAAFILAEGQKGGREGVEVLPPLIIYDGNGRYTEEMNAFYRAATQQ